MYIGRNEKSEPKNNLNSSKRSYISRILGGKNGRGLHETNKTERKEKIAAHGPSTSVVERKTQVFLFRLFVRSSVHALPNNRATIRLSKYRLALTQRVAPYLVLPRLVSSRHLRVAIQRPMHHTTPSFVSNSSALPLYVLPSSPFSPQFLTTLMDKR